MLWKLLTVMLIASWLYWVAAWWMVRAFFRARQDSETVHTPPVSVLKPARGLDAEAYHNFASFCQQDYPDYEILFGVADPADPVISVIERLQRNHPELSIRLVVAPAIGANRKVSLLHDLAAHARHEVLVVSDSDMRVTPDYLARVVGPLADERVGLVTCPYKGGLPLNLPAYLEALHMGVTFLPSVIVARRFLDMRFALGATMALRAHDLARLGSFAALAEYLADDYQLGARIAGLGCRVHLSNYVVTSILGSTRFRDEWRRELRWARCNRVSRPREYPGLLLSFSTPLATVLAVGVGFTRASCLALSASVILRWLVAWHVTRCTGDRTTRVYLAFLPLRDLLSALVWFCGGIGRRIVWRGEEFILQGDGRMRPLADEGDGLEAESHALRG